MKTEAPLVLHESLTHNVRLRTSRAPNSAESYYRDEPRFRFTYTVDRFCPAVKHFVDPIQ